MFKSERLFFFFTVKIFPLYIVDAKSVKRLRYKGNYYLIEADLDGQTVYVDGLDDDECLLELLFETYNHTLSFEIATLRELFPRQGIENIFSLRQDIANEYQLDIEQTEDNVRALIFLVNDMPELS